MIALIVLQLVTDAFRFVPLEKVETTIATHVCTVGPVVYVRKQADGDIHVTLDNGKVKVVAEIIERMPLPAPKKGQTIEVCGITRYDKQHKWPEIHPVFSWKVK